MKRILLGMCVMLLFVSGLVFGQGRVVTGKVTSLDDSSPLPGVNVLLKGTSAGTSTDSDGNYSISVADDNAVLVFSFIGYQTTEISVGARSVVDAQITTDVTQLSEVVVVGYGTQIKQDLTGNIAQVKGEAIRNLPVQSFEQAIQGRAAGVFVETGNGKLGQSVKMRIRGASSVSADNQPLYVVDGFIVTSASQSSANAATNPLVDINPNDIESIEILKDASASAIYGARASNGVVIITTRRGKSGKTVFNVNLQTGVSQETNRREFLNTAQYVELFREGAKNVGASEDDSFYINRIEARMTRHGAGNPASWNDPTSPDYVDTDWQDEVFQKGKFNQMDISASGGTDKTKVFASLSYSDQQGILIGNELTRLTGRVNIDHQATEKLTFGLNFGLSHTLNKRLSDDNAFSTPMQIVALMPMTPVIDPRTGHISGALDLNTGAPNGNYPVYYNPLLDAEYGERETGVFRNLGSVYANFKITESLNFRSDFGYDLLNQHEERYFGRETSRNSGYPNGWGTDAWTQVFNYSLNNFVQYAKSFNDQHNLEAVLGMSYQESSRNFTNTQGINFPSNSYKDLNAAASIIVGDTRETKFSFL